MRENYIRADNTETSREIQGVLRNRMVDTPRGKLVMFKIQLLI